MAARFAFWGQGTQQPGQAVYIYIYILYTYIHTYLYVGGRSSSNFLAFALRLQRTEGLGQQGKKPCSSLSFGLKYPLFTYCLCL